MCGLKEREIQMSAAKAELFGGSFARFETINEESYTRNACMESFKRTGIYPPDPLKITELCEDWPNLSSQVQETCLLAFPRCVQLTTDNGQIEESEFDEMGVPLAEGEGLVDRSSMEIYRRRFCNFLHPSIIAERKATAEQKAREASAKEASRIADAAEARLRREGLWREYCTHGFLDDRKCAIEVLPAGRKRKDDIVDVLRFLGHSGAVSSLKKGDLLKLLFEISVPQP